MSIQAPRVLGTAQRQFRQQFTALRRQTAQSIREVILGQQRLDGTLDPARLTPLQTRVGAILGAEMVIGRDAFGPDGVTALTPYARLLNDALVQVSVGVVQMHHDWLRRSVPRDVFDWLARPTQVSEQFTANPLSGYDPAHLFVDPNGYRLSDRIWQSSVRNRLALDQMLAEAIRNGTSATQLAGQVEQWLIPGRAQLRTKRPYGRDGSYDAMRLARTEITAQHGRVMLAAARSNPYAESIDWVLSPSHPKIDVCDDLAANSPYALDEVPSYPAHPHCLCHLRTNTRPLAEVTAELRAMMDAGQAAPYVTPANDYAFLLALLGPALGRLVLAQRAPVV